MELIHLVSPPQVDEEGDEALFTTEWISELAREISQQAHALADDDEEDSEWDSFLAETESSLEFRHVVEPPPAEETEPDTTPATAPAEEPAAREPENEPVEDAEISPANDAERADVSSEETTPAAVVDDEIHSTGEEAPSSPEAEVVAEVEQSPETDSTTDDEVQSINQEVLSPPEEEVVPEVELSPENESPDDEVRSTSDELPSPPEDEAAAEIDQSLENDSADDASQPESAAAESTLADDAVSEPISHVEEPEVQADEAANEIPDSKPEPESSTDDLESILYDESTLDGPSSDLTLSDMPDEDSDDDVRPKPDIPATIMDPSEVEPPPIEPPAPAPSRSKHTTTVAAAEASAPAPPKPAPARQEPRTPDVVPQSIESDAVAVAEHPGSDPDEVSQPEEWNTDVLAEPVSRAEWDAFVTNLLQDRDPSETFSVLFMDIDRFGVINKEFGRQIGNDLIREIGRRLSNFCTDHELACRYGGEQFVLFSPDLTPKKALKRAELLRKLIASTKFDVLPFQKLTASIGVTEVEDGDDLNALLDRAENALQRAKRTGRNCSVAVDSKSMNDPLPEEGKTPERSNKKKLILTTSFDAFIASDMIVYKLGGFLYENQAKLLEVDKRHVSIRVGTKGLIPYWGRKEESQPVTVNLELGEDWEKAKSSKHSVTNTTIQVTIRPEGWVRKQDVFEHRANHVLRELKAHFAAK